MTRIAYGRKQTQIPIWTPDQYPAIVHDIPNAREDIVSKIGLEKLSLEELQELRKDVVKTIASFEARKRQEARDQVAALAQELGFSLEELVDRKARKPKAAVAAKYRHPKDPSPTWSGRGRQPAWFKAALASGSSLEELEVS